MVLFLITLFVLLILLVTTVVVVGVGGAVGVVIFSDVIVCIAIIVWLIKKFSKKKG